MRRALPLAVLLAAVAFAAVACGSDADEPDPAAAPPAVTDAPPTTAPAEEPEPPPDDDEPEEPSEPEPAPPVEPEPPAEPPADPGIPAAVEATRDAILDAARTAVRTGDYSALEALVDPESFTYSFGESGDPIGHWRELEEVGEVPVLGDFLPVVLNWPWAKRGDVYIWPSAHAKLADRWRPRDTEPLLQLYTLEEIEMFREFGGYLGWRVGILEDGTWIYFVAGD